jgi:hypothetical protein
MDWDPTLKPARVFGRTVAIGWCPRCGPGTSVTISQPVLEWADQAQTDPEIYGQLEMECGVCGATMEDVTLPLDESQWQLLIECRRPAKTPKVVPFERLWARSQRRARV